MRLSFAAAGIFAGNAALLLYLLSNALILRVALLEAHMGEPALALPQAWQIFELYALFSLAGWILVGLPVALAVPARLLSRAGLPLCILIGALLGPLALLMIFLLLFAAQGRIGEFSLAHTASLWPFSVLVSAVSFLVYWALLRRRVGPAEP